jgi:hypothetical protein
MNRVTLILSEDKTMCLRIYLVLFFFIAALVLPFMPVSADPASSRNTPPAGVPSKMNPPNEDLAEIEADEAGGSAEEKPFDIPMILNHSVENHIDYFNTRGRKAFQLWLNRSARYLSMMKDIFREKNLPEELVYVAMIESGLSRTMTLSSMTRSCSKKAPICASSRGARNAPMGK